MLNKKEITAFSIVVLLSTFVFLKIYDFPYEKNIFLKISKQRGSIKDLDTRKNIAYSREFYVDLLEFPKADELKHKRLGKIGFNNNFFIEFDSEFVLKGDENITFAVRSDDGFRFIIDGVELFSYPKDRGYELSKKELSLKKGDHKIRVEYFQGGGPLGIGVYYKSKGKTYTLGESTSNVTFREYQ